jgi:flagellar basal-body rod modification protein FlgD
MSTVTSATGPQNWGNIQDLIGGQTEQKTQATTTGGLANAEIFMQLLVAQLKNQNPMNPADGTEFVAQLAQFSQLEQTLGMRDELKAIRAVLEQAAGGSATQTP